MDRNNTMDMKPLSAIDMCQRDQSYKWFDPLSSDPSNGPTNANNQHVALSSYSAPDADTSHSNVSTAGLLAQAPIGHLENNFGSVSQNNDVGGDKGIGDVGKG